MNFSSNPDLITYLSRAEVHVYNSVSSDVNGDNLHQPLFYRIDMRIKRKALIFIAWCLMW